MVRRFLRPYWIVQFLLSPYAPVRLVLHPRPKVLLTRDQLLGLTQGDIITLAIFLFRQYRRSSTADEFLSQSIMYCKATVAVFLYFIDARLAVWYVVALIVAFVAVARPKYQGPASFKALTPAEFEFNILGPAGAKRDWIVFFHASWSSQCDNMMPMFAQLSLAYATEHLKFATFDVGRWADFVARHKLNVDATVSSLQLPTFALYESSRESRRLPPFDKKGGVTSTYIDAAGCVSYFDLDRRLEMGSEYVPAKGKKAAGGESKSSSNKKKKK